MGNGILLTIEGIHGSGKSTISQKLVEQLKGSRLHAMLAIDQAGTEVGRKIRRINLGEGNQIDILTEALLIAAARRQNIADVIKPSIFRGEIVICERYIDAYFAFQGHARGLPFQFLECISSTIAQGIAPDLTILLDLKARTALSRLNIGQMHRIEKEPPEFHEKVRQGYLEQAMKYPERIKIVDASRPIDIVFRDAWGKVKDFLITKGAIKC